MKVLYVQLRPSHHRSTFPDSGFLCRQQSIVKTEDSQLTPKSRLPSIHPSRLHCRQVGICREFQKHALTPVEGSRLARNRQAVGHQVYRYVECQISRRNQPRQACSFQKNSHRCPLCRVFCAERLSHHLNQFLGSLSPRDPSSCQACVEPW